MSYSANPSITIDEKGIVVGVAGESLGLENGLTFKAGEPISKLTDNISFQFTHDFGLYWVSPDGVELMVHTERSDRTKCFKFSIGNVGRLKRD